MPNPARKSELYPSGYLVDVEKVKPEEWERWREENPEAFERDYDPAAGLRFEGWVEDGRG